MPGNRAHRIGLSSDAPDAWRDLIVWVLARAVIAGVAFGLLDNLLEAEAPHDPLRAGVTFGVAIGLAYAFDAARRRRPSPTR